MSTIEFDKEEVLGRIKNQIAENAILLYMKGNPEQPRCGFSARAIQVLQACGYPFASVDILENQDIRQVLPEYAEWPTFPQLWIQGELIGGSDIMLEMYESGELEPLLEQASEDQSQHDTEKELNRSEGEGFSTNKQA
jgi:monothiol glutaredoxin